MQWKIYSLIGGAALFSTAVIAQPQKGSQKPAAATAITRPAVKNANTASAPEGTVLIYSPNGCVWDDAQQIGRAKKETTVSQVGEDFILYCDDLTYNKKTNRAVARINLKVESRDSTITGNLIQADFNAKTITVTGNVVMNSHGTNDGIKANGKRRKLPLQLEGKASTMKCDRIVFNYENREADITGNIRMIQDKNSGTCLRIVFDEASNIAKMIDKVEFTNEDGQTFRSPLVTIWIDDNLIRTGVGDLEIPQNNTNKKAQPKTDFGPKPTLEIDEETQKILSERTEPDQPAGKTPANTPASTPSGSNSTGRQTEEVNKKPVEDNTPVPSPVDEEKDNSDKAGTKTARREDNQ